MRRALTLRRPEHEARIEIMPLIDVIFLLLTFFIYAMVLMVRADLLPVQMHPMTSGTPAQPAPAVTVSIDQRGALYVDREPVAMEEIVGRLEAARAAEPDTVIYLAAEATGETDRLPTFLTLHDRLAAAGLDFTLVGRASDAERERDDG